MELGFRLCALLAGLRPSTWPFVKLSGSISPAVCKITLLLSTFAAGYGWKLLLNRPSVDGSKWMALAVMVVCLEMSRLGWKCGEVEETAMVLRAAAGGMKGKKWEAWVVGKVGKK